MKKSELKKLLKPIVQECIKESLLEDGLISGIISEVVKGMNHRPLVEARVQPEPAPQVDPAMERMRTNAFSKEQSSKLKEHKQKLMSAIGGAAYNGVDLFEGTTPAPAQAAPTAQASPMSGQAPNDPGVDINSLLGSVGRHWKAHMEDV